MHKTFKDKILANGFLNEGEYLISPNGHYQAKLQTDGNFCIYVNLLLNP